VTELTEFCFFLYKIIRVLRAMSCMAGKTSIIQGLMALNPHKRSIFVARETLIIPNLFEIKLIIRGMGIVTG
jgi:hypothetical protein